jgi:hypothetical protein
VWHNDFEMGKIFLSTFFLQRLSFMSQTIKVTAFSISLIVIATFGISCATKLGEHQGEKIMAKKPIEKVLKEQTQKLMSIPGVVGTAQGLCNNKPCIKVYVVKKTSGLDQKIPNSLEGYPVSVEETGEIRALPKNQTEKQ